MKNKILRYIVVILIRIAIAWTALHFAGFEYQPHEVAFILIAGWAMFYNIGGTTVNNNLIYNGNDK